MTCIQECDLHKSGHMFGIVAVNGTPVLTIMVLQSGLHYMSVLVIKKRKFNSCKKRLKIEALLIVRNFVLNCKYCSLEAELEALKLSTSFWGDYF